MDYALSFQDPDGCTELWEQICSLQGRPADGPPREAETAMGSASHEDMTQRDAQPQLPAPEMRNLQAIAELLVEVPIFRRAKLVEAVLQQDYVLQLVTLFNTVEDLENVPDLHHLFHIFKGLVLLNDTGVYEELLREDLIVSVIGALEYDPELSCHSVNHRAFLKEKVKFNQVVPIGDAPTVRKIHQNFHVSFIKDVVLPRALDDHTFAALNQIAFLNNVQIVSHLCNDADYLKRVCEKIGDGEQNAEERHDSLRLLQARPKHRPWPPPGRARSRLHLLSPSRPPPPPPPPPPPAHIHRGLTLPPPAASTGALRGGEAAAALQPLGLLSQVCRAQLLRAAQQLPHAAVAVHAPGEHRRAALHRAAPPHASRCPATAPQLLAVLP